MSAEPGAPFLRDSIVESTSTPRGSEYLAPPTGPHPDRSLTSTPGDSSPFLAGNNKENYNDEAQGSHARPVYKRPWFWLVAAGVLAIVVLAVVLPVYFVVVKPNQHNTTSGDSASTGESGSSGNHGQSGSNGSKTQNTVKVGGDGSTVTKEDGSTFTYKNAFGGYCEYPHLFFISYPSTPVAPHI